MPPTHIEQTDPSGRLSLALTGALSVRLGDAELDLPPSKKARALLAYLATTGRPQRREHLVGLLRNESEDGREGLRD
jgi:DNA-binding SARP family transcriptional activator